ncbi:hypothetical protein A3J43_02470 [Candidatus Uhrbacteria bacterium RIFCSPHIGHO2_12_FULL_54_23]|uniref:O-antigen ligase-related domain-containing protein n=2 Tax=Candidatus Uhriibacteriota TaxID=1752732 RepID=A0A1F7UKX7_9BACT|nr:MAG: hypothetical protein A3J43_02470 [Candidatus Uhrbacteria bacterium RIFCSPHIGHO2_12_FULL_54_23]OGL83763.1 MAG: hypothetical protein A3B36_00755 [Candidatus Uhrbacteria bacterium RIFCSPLOWO2_01_FULL_55_36]
MKIFWMSFCGAVFLFIVSFAGWAAPAAGSIATALLSAGVFALHVRAPAWATGAVIAELAFGGQGWWLSFAAGGMEVPVRMMLFGALMAAWMAQALFSRSVIASLSLRAVHGRIRFLLMLVGIMAAWGIGWGLMRGNSFAQVFFDANGWWYGVLVFPVVAACRDGKGLSRIMQMTAGAGIATAVLTLFLYHVFDHQYAIAETLYHWMRDTLLGEITFIRPGAWRIFMQSQVWLLWVWIWAIAAAVFKKKTGSCFVFISLLASSALLVSASRSYWVGWGAMIILYIGLSVFQFKVWKYALVIIAICLVGGFLLMFAVQRIPPIPTGFSLKGRMALLDEAGSSRVFQLKPLFEAIARHPVIGSGFGTAVEYRSADPRIVAGTAGGTGKYMTYAFEWGYFDTWLKIGLAGLGAYVWLIFSIGKQLWIKFNQPPISNDRYIWGVNAIALACLCALISLAAVNVFSPYLNHPLGIGMVLVCMGALAAAVGQENNTSIKKQENNLIL